jgi:hypothetical protein
MKTGIPWQYCVNTKFHENRPVSVCNTDNHTSIREWAKRKEGDMPFNNQVLKYTLPLKLQK